MSILLLPARIVVGLIAAIINVTGRLVAIVLGLGLMVLGTLLSLTGVGIIVGLPLLLFGLALVLRALR